MVNNNPKYPNKAMRFLTVLAQSAFGLTIILTPVRWRLTLTPRPHPPIYGDYTDFLLFAPDLAMLTTLVFWGVSLIFAPRKITLGKAHIWFPLLGLISAAWLSVSSSLDAPLSIYHAVRLLALFLFYLYIVNEIHGLAWVALPVALQVILQATIAIGQSLLQEDLGLRWLGEYALDPAWSGVSVVEANGIRFLRAYGLSDHPNILAGCLAFGLIIVLMTYLHSKESCTISPLPFLTTPGVRRLTAAAFVLGSLALGMTFSRSGWLAFISGTGFLLGIRLMSQGWKGLKPLGALTAITLSLLAAFVWINRPYFGVRLNAGGSFSKPTAENQAIGERALLNAIANRIFAEHALRGVGLGASPLAIKARYPEFPTDYQPPHFTLLAAAMETGIFGAAFYFLLLLTPWFVFLTHRSRLKRHSLVVTALALLLAIDVVGFFDYYTWLLVPGRLWQWIAWGFWVIALEKHELA